MGALGGRYGRGRERGVREKGGERSRGQGGRGTEGREVGAWGNGLERGGRMWGLGA